MASTKRIGFFWGEEKATFVGFEKNAPLQFAISPLDSKVNSSLISSLTEEFQTAIAFQKIVEDNRFTGGQFYISLPMKEIVLRSFVIPFVKPEERLNIVKFEAKKYLPIDIQELAFVFYASPFTENKVKRLQIIFFAVRQEVLQRYERIFKQQLNAVISCCEPCAVSLTKVLLFKKEITPADHLAFLTLDKNSGRIFFINKGIPQFVREFSFSMPVEESPNPSVLNLKIVNEVANSFDFYTRQFNVEAVGQLLVSGTLEEGLCNALDSELKLKLRKVAPLVTMGQASQNNDVDTIYAMGACVEPPLDALAGFNFLGDHTPKFNLQTYLTDFVKSYKEAIIVFLVCALCLCGLRFLLDFQLTVLQKQYHQLTLRQQAYQYTSVESIQSESQNDTDQLASYKNIRIKSDLARVVLRVSSHLPQGGFLDSLSIKFHQEGSDELEIEINGGVRGGDPNAEIKVVNRIFSDLKEDKKLAAFIKTVNLASISRENVDGKPVTIFIIHCS